MTDQSNQKDASHYFDRLLGVHKGWDARIKSVPIDISATGLELRAHFLHPAFRNNEVLIKELTNFLVSRVTAFCMSRQERRDAVMARADDADTQAVDDLNRRARGLFIKVLQDTARSGEGGEVLLYVLTEVFLKAPLVVSKMALKTSSQMPVHGADGIHATWEDAGSRLIIYFGESKFHQGFSAAIGDALGSISKIISNNKSRRDREIDLISSFADFDSFPKEMIDALKKYLHPYKYEEANDRAERFSVLVGFDYEAYTKILKENPSKHESHFRGIYEKDSENKIKSIVNKLGEKGIHHSVVDFFIFPVPSVEEFRQAFRDSLNG